MQELMTLFELAERDGDDVVAFVAGQPLSRRSFRAMIAANSDRLSDAPGGRWAVVCDCPIAFAAALLALLRTGREPIILPHAQPGLLGDAAGLTDGLITDGPGTGYDRPIASAAAATASEHSPALPQANWAEGMALFTSGSSGVPQLIEKPLPTIEAEFRTMETAFGDRLPNCHALSTVSHQHIYGMLFRLLWPMSAGRPVVDAMVSFPEDLHAQLRRYAPAYLVASPAFLKRTAKILDKDLLSGNCVLIFSSGASLPETLAADLNSTFDGRVTEIYGSTETGGVAWRAVRDPEHWGWTPLPGIETDISGGHLRIRSPHQASDEWCQSEDRVQARADGTFRLLGRADRVVKIEEKRVDLSSLESRLHVHPDIADARAVVLEGGHRSQLAVVAVPSDGGWQALAEHGKNGFRSRLSEYLGSHFERVTLPRRWRFVRALPETRQGKVPQQALAALFGVGETPRMLPEILAQSVEAGQPVWRLRIPPDLHVLEGHFPGVPVVAGVAQLGWVEHFARAAFDLADGIGRLEVIKFRKILPPDTTVNLSLRHDQARDKVHFRFADDEGDFASGRLCFGDQE